MSGHRAGAQGTSILSPCHTPIGALPSRVTRPAFCSARVPFFSSIFSSSPLQSPVSWRSLLGCVVSRICGSVEQIQRNQHLEIVARRFSPPWRGTSRIIRSSDAFTGSSPRGRGTLPNGVLEHARIRFIPAWAGNTATWRRPPARASVHPRVGGEHLVGTPLVEEPFGSSPRGRGTPEGPHQHGRDPARFIPAWAGNTPLTQSSTACRTVHPRVGGEHSQISQNRARADGSSPRGRGTHRRVRGRRHLHRFIPAWAGNTSPGRRNRLGRSVHPRVGGEHSRLTIAIAIVDGSSPRGRGTLRCTVHRAGKGRFIPAWAGNTRRWTPRSCPSTVHPAWAGNTFALQGGGSDAIGSSPRGRGTRHPRGRCPAGHRFIPAWAGNTADCDDAPGSPSVHPRVGGEHIGPAMPRMAPIGSSPRGRGTRDLLRRGSFLRRFIPAWAGNTSSEMPARRQTTVHPRVGGEHSALGGRRSS